MSTNKMSREGTYKRSRLAPRRFTRSRAYQKPPTAGVRGVRKGSTTLTQRGIQNTVNRLRGYALSAAAEGRLPQARKYARALSEFLGKVKEAMASAGIPAATESEINAALEGIPR